MRYTQEPGLSCDTTSQFHHNWASFSHHDKTQQQHWGLAVNVLCIWLPADCWVQLKAGGAIQYHFTTSHQNHLPGVWGWCSSSQQECSGYSSAIFSLVGPCQVTDAEKTSVSLGFSEGRFVFQIWQPDDFFMALSSVSLLLCCWRRSWRRMRRSACIHMIAQWSDPHARPPCHCLLSTSRTLLLGSVRGWTGSRPLVWTSRVTHRRWEVSNSWPASFWLRHRRIKVMCLLSRQMRLVCSPSDLLQEVWRSVFPLRTSEITSHSCETSHLACQLKFSFYFVLFETIIHIWSQIIVHLFRSVIGKKGRMKKVSCFQPLPQGKKKKFKH